MNAVTVAKLIASDSETLELLSPATKFVAGLPLAGKLLVSPGVVLKKVEPRREK